MHPGRPDRHNHGRQQGEHTGDDYGQRLTYMFHRNNHRKSAGRASGRTASGLKLTHGFTIESDNETTLFIDFNTDKSLHQTGAGDYKLKPTIKVLDELPQD